MISQIQRKTHTSDWRRIPTTDNPADLISRGRSPEDFLLPTIWQHGPEWFQQSEGCWPTWNPVETPEQKKATCLSLTPTDHSLPGRFSSWPKLIRITARCLRWRQSRIEETSNHMKFALSKQIEILQ